MKRSKSRAWIVALVLVSPCLFLGWSFYDPILGKVLMGASARGNIEFAETLLKYRANVNHQDVDGNTPVTVAAAEGHAEMVEFLLKSGANPWIANQKGLDAFDLANDPPTRKVLEEFKRRPF